MEFRKVIKIVEPLVKEVRDVDELTADVTINKDDGTTEVIRVSRVPFSDRRIKVIQANGSKNGQG